MNKNYREYGFVHHKGFFARGEMKALTRQVHDVFAASLQAQGLPCRREEDGRVCDDDLFSFYDKHRDDYIACMRVVQNLTPIFAIGSNDRLIDALKDVGVEKPVFSSRPIITLSSKRTASHCGHWKTPAHQDWRSIQGSLNSVVVWISLEDVTKDLGPLEVVPGSHKMGLLPAEPDEWYMHIVDGHVDEEAFQPVMTEVGDMLIFSTFLVHRSGINRLNRHRYALQYRYNDLFETTFIEKSFPTVYLSDKPVHGLLDSDFPTLGDLERVFGQ